MCDLVILSMCGLNDIYEVVLYICIDIHYMYPKLRIGGFAVP